MNKIEILKRRFLKMQRHFTAFGDYKNLINNLLDHIDIYNINNFNNLKPEEKAILDAYLKRFSSMQDYLGAKIFPLILEIAGIGAEKMSDVLYYIEKEQIIDNLENWIELREIRNGLEHDYPEELQEALNNLKYCIDNFTTLEKYYKNSLEFAKRYAGEII